MKPVIILAALLALTVPAHSEGDATKGAADFKNCKACHAIIADDGTVIQKGGKLAPNLFGVIGRPVASYPDFKYSVSILAVGEKGVIWDEALLAAYITDPTAWLKEQTGDDAASAKMTFKLKSGGEDVAAYLASIK